MKILVVDDENMQLKSMRIGLRTEGHSVVTALSAEEAIELVKADSEPFDLIITDYLLTGISGLDLLKTVRAEKQFIPVIMMTAYGRKELVMWFPQFFTAFLPGWVINIALIVHSDETLLAAGFIFTIHFFNTHFRLEKFPMDNVIFSGRISKTECQQPAYRQPVPLG